MATLVGFVGLGQMGLPMVGNLARAPGIEVLAHDLVDTPFKTLSEHPAWGHTLRRAPDLDALAACSQVIVMLPNSEITNRVIEGGNGQPGLAAILGPGATLIDMGSSNPSETLRIGQILAARGLHLVDAPVSGAVAKARSGELTIMAGCTEHRLDEIRPLLQAMGSRIIATGGLASAHSMKALNNYVYAAGLLAASEALCIARRLDLDLEIFTDVLNTSSGRNVATETKLRQFILSESYAGGFALGLQAKDLRTAASLQELADFPAAQLAACAALWERAAQALPAGTDNTGIHRFLDAGGARSTSEEELACHS